MDEEKLTASLAGQRAEIDVIDREMLRLFRQRLEAVRKINALKATAGLPVRNHVREQEVRRRAELTAGPEFAAAAGEFIETVMAISRRCQHQWRRQSAADSSRILVLNGPNLNLLGCREPEIYGNESYEALCRFIRETADELDLTVEIRQSNGERELTEWIQEAPDNFAAVIINPAAFTHTSIAIPDALKAVALPAVEVHLTDVNAREEFRRISYTAAACCQRFCGGGFESYRQALVYLEQKLRSGKEK